MEDKKGTRGIWQGGTTKVESKMSEEEARFWRGFEDYNDNIGIESDFAAEYTVEIEMRNNKNNKTPVSGMGGRGGPVDSVRFANKSKPKVSKENNK